MKILKLLPMKSKILYLSQVYQFTLLTKENKSMFSSALTRCFSRRLHITVQPMAVSINMPTKTNEGTMDGMAKDL